VVVVQSLKVLDGLGGDLVGLASGLLQAGDLQGRSQRERQRHQGDRGDHQRDQQLDQREAIARCPAVAVRGRAGSAAEGPVSFHTGTFDR
jgi:hypothetical protein